MKKFAGRGNNHLTKVPCTEFAFNILYPSPWHPETSCSVFTAKNKSFYHSWTIKNPCPDLITNWLQVGHIYPGMFLVWPAEFGNTGVKIEISYKNRAYKGFSWWGWGKGTEYLRPLYPHSSGNNLLESTAAPFSYSTDTPICHVACHSPLSTPGQFHSFTLLFWPLKTCEFANPI